MIFFQKKTSEYSTKHVTTHTKKDKKVKYSTIYF